MSNRCLHCGVGPTIQAHILPQSALRAIRTRGPDSYTMAVFYDRAVKANTQNGIYDSNILCSKCDQKIAPLDKWFMENLNVFHDCVVKTPSSKPTKVNIDALFALRFAVSVIYRASLSNLVHFNNINLGTYTEIAAKITFDEYNAYDVPIVLINVQTSDYLDTRQYVSYPVGCRGDNGIYFIFVISGVQFLVKFGGRSRRIVSNDRGYSTMLRVRPGCPVSVLAYPFEKSGEAKFMYSAGMSNHHKR